MATICLSLLLGSIIGSFLNVLIYRIPYEVSIITPRSFCPLCKTTIPFYRNIPVLSYFIQMGHCSTCHKKIPMRYPLVEIISAFGMYITWHTFPNIDGILFYWMFSHLLVISFIDNQWLQIPLSIIMSMSLGLLIYHLFYKGDYIFLFKGMITGLGFISFIYAITWLIYKKNTLGFGDFQLIAVLGAWEGQINIIFILFLSSILALVAFIFISFFKGYKRTMKLPFAPYLSLAAVIIYIFNP